MERVALFAGSFDPFTIGHQDIVIRALSLFDRVGAKFIIRGLRSGTDFDYERTIAQANSMLAPEIETLFLVTRKEHAPIASTVVRDVIIHGGDVRPFMPAEIDLSRYPQNPR